MASEFPADRIKYYEGWATFFKQLSAHGGTIVLLPAAVAEPPPKVKVVMFNKGKVRMNISLSTLFCSLLLVKRIPFCDGSRGCCSC